MLHMRIISQDRTRNLSLDSVHLVTERTGDIFLINATDSFWSDDDITIAKYSTREKCQIVFENIIFHCQKESSVIMLPKDEEVQV